MTPEFDKVYEGLWDNINKAKKRGRTSSKWKKSSKYRKQMKSQAKKIAKEKKLCARGKAAAKAKPNVPRFGPLERGCHVLAKDSLANIVRETAVQADIACRFLTEMNGGTYISHTMERLKQIRRMEERL